MHIPNPFKLQSHKNDKKTRIVKFHLNHNIRKCFIKVQNVLGINLLINR